MLDLLKAIYTVLEVVIAVVCCLGNLLVIWAVWKCGAMRRQPTFCFIVSLAVADFLVGALAIPLAVLADDWVITSFYTCVFRSCWEIVVTQASIHSLTSIALDRFLRVYMPLRYKATMTQKLSWTIVGSCWLSAGVLGFVPMFGWYRHDTLEQMEANNSLTMTCKFLAVIPMTYMVYFNFFTCLLPPMLLMMGLYLCIFLKMHKHLRGIGVSGSESRSYYQKEQKLTRSLVLVLMLFAFSWLPLHFMNTAAFYGCFVPHQAFYVGVILAHANSAMHPVVYALRIHQIRAACKIIGRKYFLCSKNHDVGHEAHVARQRQCPNPKGTDTSFTEEAGLSQVPI